MNRRIQISKIPVYCLTFFKILIPVFRIFKNPFSILGCYLNESLTGNIVLRNGYQIHASIPADILTIVSIFCKRDYGRIKPGSVVADIGANIGAFSLYSVMSGAEKVYAFEPCEDSFNILTKNIKANHLEKKIIARRVAITDKNSFVQFPKTSNPSNTIGNGVKTKSETLNVAFRDIPSIDLLKLDCEGSEHLILPVANLEKVKEIRMEYHESLPTLPDFSLNFLERTDEHKGMAFFRNTSC